MSRGVPLPHLGPADEPGESTEPVVMVRCPPCHGDGRVRLPSQDRHSIPAGICQFCNGSGDLPVDEAAELER